MSGGEITVHRLRNWGRWLRRRGQTQGQTPSLEGNWRSPQHWYELPPDRPIKPIEADAWDIELACRVLPVKYHLLLELRYVWLSGTDEIQEFMRRGLRLRMTATDIVASEAMAIVLLREAMEFPAVVRMVRAQTMVRRILATHLTTQAESL